jgi:hypothetical protein
MKILLIVTTLWQGNPEANTVSFRMPNIAECHRQAGEWRRHHGDDVIATCKMSNELPTFRPARAYAGS